MIKREIYHTFLQKVPILANLTEVEILTLADSLVEETFSRNETVCKEGDRGDYFYIIKEGLADCTQIEEATGRMKLVGSLQAGDYFGEISLLTQNNRQV